ncbi:MAG TPA: hypothetical protein H9875_08505 [Candidatus Levilactobacillus faecigallinarum]|uniref:Uncharacterized protein n=1 Tax=Candidatus Levilactobacillus faecigallinarum TaxID=2838638 RepID=A0A9D1QU04_9LACO|nr:hypothetical protein [Candidatus Levilactobacillus faecigallinarum]
MQDEHGSSQANVVQFNLKDVSGKYLGIALRETHTRDVYWRGIGFFIPDGGNLIKVPLDELEEIDE